MSDQPMGPGWWLASDGKYYPPQPPQPPQPQAPPPQAFQAPPHAPQQFGAPPQQFGAPPTPYGVPGNQGWQQPGGPMAPPKKSKAGLILGIVALVLIVGVGGCIAVVGLAANEVAKEADENEARTVTPDGDTGSSSGGGGPAGDRSAPLPLGTEVDLGNGWRVKVNSADLGPGAPAAVAAANEYNESAGAGLRYIVVNVSVTYVGNGEDATESPGLGFGLSVFGSDNVERNSYDHFAVPPEPALDEVSELAEGGVATGNMVFAVGENETSLVARVEPVFSFDSTESWLALE